jgi:hypothetical protein
MNKGRASFGTGDVAPACFPNNNMNKGRWTQDKHKVFMQENEKYGNNCMQNCKSSSTRTPTQIKRHAECFFKQNLKTNSAAVKRNQESLSPDEKAQVLVKNVTEQRKHQQFLSSKDKAQMLNKDAAAHKKQHESLPPEKKVKILQTNAAVHTKTT